MITVRLPLAFAFCTVLAGGLHAQDQGPVEVNGIAAKVNGRVITRNEVTFMLAPSYAQLSAQYPRRGQEFQERFTEARNKIIQELIDRELILDEFKQLKASLPEGVVDSEIKRQVNLLHNGDKSKLSEELRRNRLTMEKYRQMTYEKLVVQAMRSSHFADAPPPLPNEIQAEYQALKDEMRDVSKDMISFRKIFIPAGDPQDATITRDTQLALAEQIVADLKAGKDFAELAKAHSKDAFAEQGGLQEDVPRLDLSTEFAAIIFDAKENQLVGPIADFAGFIIAQPTKIVRGPAPSLSEIRDVVEERVRRRKNSAQYEHWIAKLRKRAIIQIKM